MLSIYRLHCTFSYKSFATLARRAPLDGYSVCVIDIPAVISLEITCSRTIDPFTVKIASWVIRTSYNILWSNLHKRLHKIAVKVSCYSLVFTAAYPLLLLFLLLLLLLLWMLYTLKVENFAGRLLNFVVPKHLKFLCFAGINFAVAPSGKFREY